MKNIENLNIDASAKENVMTWLNGQYDEETKQAIRDMIKRGEISAVRVGRQYRIARSEIERITTPTGGKP